MIELIDTQPAVGVPDSEYTRLLGFPPGHELEGRARELGEWARRWYAQHGRPWVYAREAGSLTLSDESLAVDGATFTSGRLRRTLEQADAHNVVLVAVSAGPEIEQAASRAWRDEKPDEYFFLEVYASAVVEHLATATGARLCAWADGERMTILPHYSPGYPDWTIADQPQLLEVIGRRPLPGPVEVLDSGMLRPKKSLLAIFGVTRHTDRVRRLTELIPCDHCSFTPCQFRRAPYGRSARSEAAEAASANVAPAKSDAPRYAVNTAALRRWTAERLSLATAGDGTIDALFRYEGTTCSSLGRPLAFHYHVRLGPREQGYPIREQRCVPAPGDEGHTFMCRYITDGAGLLGAVDRETPLAGEPLHSVLSWRRPATGPGCYCEPDARLHKWGLVLETIHYALTHDRTDR